MVNGRNKGANFERETANALRDELGIGFKRNLIQYQEADHGDLTPDDSPFPFTLELKRYKDGPIGGAPAWWEQVKTAAEREQKMPCLIYKYDRKPMRCVIPLAALTDCDHDYTVEVDFETFCYIAREAMQ